MKNSLLLLFLFISVSILMTSCNKQDSPVDPADAFPGSGSAKTCDTSAFTGVESISNIKDTSIDLNWNSVTENLGFTIFKKELTGLLEFVSSIPAERTSFTVRDLEASSDYQFLVKSIGTDGLHDCNTHVEEVTTLSRQTFKSCFDIAQYYGPGQGSGSYEIDTDLSGPNNPFNVYCEMDANGGGWTKILVHKAIGGLFANDAEALSKNEDNVQADIYSILGHLEEFKRDGKFEFWLNYPEIDSIDSGNQWTQTSNPTTDVISDYVEINIDHTGQRWGGIEKGNSNTFINGSVGHSNWFYAIGAKRYWPSTGSIPGPDGAITQVYLYVK